MFDCATSCFSGALILQCVITTYVELWTSCCLSWKASLVPSLHLIYWSYNLPLRHSLACCRCCLIASSWNLPANVSDHLQHFDFFRDVNCVHDEKYPPCPRWFLLSSTTPLTSFHRELLHIIITTCSPASVVFCLEVLLSFLSRMLWGLLHLLEILRYDDTSHHHHSSLVPVLFLTGEPTIELWCATSKLLPTLLLWS